ncbi:hypothetical protein HU200_044329 [Digitaria exilis]|uniref:BHLH domain-containing protein n=1 Tax=Digitaria exilis TaxID=1010633 RepID=A0A835B9N7_9POAL|nr:hypothetical protein HU200_044329 [Digitaria exilis]CAB3493739.1 unnamed protein product [Digitaria exilis]
MEDTSLVFTKWASPNPGAAAADHGSSRATFPSLHALREASHAAEMVQELIADEVVHAPNSWSSGDIAANNWNFGATSAPPGSNTGVTEVIPAIHGLPPDLVYGAPPPPTRRRSAAGIRSVGGSMSASYAQDHIIAERKRREKINQRFIELSTVIPGLKKMDKATILSDATSYVKELQEKVKDMEAGGGGGSGRSSIVETRLVVVKRPCLHLHASAVTDDDGSPSPGTPLTAWKELPEIEVRFSESEKSVMVRVHCENSKGALVKVLTEMEELQLTIIHANVMFFPACTLTMAITAKASFFISF